MKKGLMFALIILGTITFMMQDALAKPSKAPKLNAVSRLAHAGDIVGNVTTCMDVPAALGIIVYIPGTSFSAFTDESGNFTIYNVPEGTYDLNVEADGVFAVPEASIPDFNVLGKVQNVVCPSQP